MYNKHFAILQALIAQLVAHRKGFSKKNLNLKDDLKDTHYNI